VGSGSSSSRRRPSLKLFFDLFHGSNSSVYSPRTADLADLFKISENERGASVAELPDMMMMVQFY
jgi:hypothetical protein